MSRAALPRWAGSALVVLAVAPAPGLAAEPSLVVDLAALSPSGGKLRRVHASQGLGDLGLPVAGGFDCDGDGARDYGLASMRASPGGVTGAGIAYLVFGDGTLEGTIDTGVPQPTVLEILGEGPAEATGSEVWMDDVTGDGLGDYLIGRQNFRPDGARPGAGALTILAGSPALAAHAAALEPLRLARPPAGIVPTTFVGAGAVDRLGIWMRTGDVTGDGIADIAVGADQEDGGGEGDRGAVYVIRGGPHLAGAGTVDLADFGATALAGHIARIVPPPGSEEFHLGATCQVGDLDGNGRGEVMAAAALNRAGASIPAAGAPAGSAHANAGSSDGTLYIVWDDNFPAGPWPAGLHVDIGTAPGSVTVIDGGAANRDFGEELLGGRDYDADGAPDLFVGDIVGDLHGGRPNAGAGHVLYDAGALKGRSFDMDAPPPGLRRTDFLGGAAGDIAADTGLHGDFDGDGVDDLAFSSPHASPPDRTRAGVLHIFWGQPGGWPGTINLAPGALPEPGTLRTTWVLGAKGALPGDAGDTLGYSAAAADLDRDGRADLITNEMVGNGPSGVDRGNLILLAGAVVSPPACSDGLDNDGDGAADHPADPECVAPFWVVEEPECRDGRDNDADGRVDFPDDPQCSSALFPLEETACGDGRDNDADGFADLADPECSGNPFSERRRCGLGMELILALPLLLGLRRRRAAGPRR